MAFDSSVPLHHQIERLLRARIVSQEWAPGDRIPTEVELARFFGTSRTTIRHAIRPLVEDQLLVRHRAKGTFVPASPIPSQGCDVAFSNQVLGYQAVSRFVCAETVSASTRVATILDVERFTPLRRFVRVETIAAEVVAVVMNFVKPEFARKIRKTDLQRHSMIECLRLRAGLVIGKVRISVSATMPDEEVAELLAVDLTHPVLRVLVIAEDEVDQPVQAAYGYYRSDRVSFEQTLDRQDVGSGSVLNSPLGGRLAVSMMST